CSVRPNQSRSRYCRTTTLGSAARNGCKTITYAAPTTNFGSTTSRSATPSWARSRLPARTRCSAQAHILCLEVARRRGGRRPERSVQGCVGQSVDRRRLRALEHGLQDFAGHALGTYQHEVAIDKITFNADGSIQKLKPSTGL